MGGCPCPQIGTIWSESLQPAAPAPRSVPDLPEYSRSSASLRSQRRNVVDHAGANDHPTLRQPLPERDLHTLHLPPETVSGAGVQAAAALLACREWWSLAANPAEGRAPELGALGARASGELWDLTGRLLREFIEEYYHVARPHQGLGGDTPILRPRAPANGGSEALVSTPVLGGLHHRYERRAA